MIFDVSTKNLLRAGMYAEVPLHAEFIEGFVLGLLSRGSDSSNYPLGLFSYLLFSSFNKKLQAAVAQEIINSRAGWLLAHSQAQDLLFLDAEQAERYFNNLDREYFEKYLADWKTIVVSNWVKNLFYKTRHQFFISLFRKYGSFILFWCLIFLGVFVGLHITTKENSLSIWDQVQGWLNFLLYRLK